MSLSPAFLSRFNLRYTIVYTNYTNLVLLFGIQRMAACAGIPHHLIDILDPFDITAEYSAGQFHDAAHAAVAEVLSRGRTPLVIGGTGFYLRTFMSGKPGGGKATPEMEQRVCDLLRTALTKCTVDLGLQHNLVAAAGDTEGYTHEHIGLSNANRSADAAAECASAASEI